jgi:hypothetical protein
VSSRWRAAERRHPTGRERMGSLHPADTPRTNLADALGVLSRRRLSQTPTRVIRDSSAGAPRVQPSDELVEGRRVRHHPLPQREPPRVHLTTPRLRLRLRRSLSLLHLLPRRGDGVRGVARRHVSGERVCGCGSVLQGAAEAVEAYLRHIEQRAGRGGGAHAGVHLQGSRSGLSRIGK